MRTDGPTIRIVGDERIRWVSHVDGDGTDYDILSFDTNGRDRQVAVSRPA